MNTGYDIYQDALASLVDNMDTLDDLKTTVDMVIRDCKQKSLMQEYQAHHQNLTPQEKMCFSMEGFVWYVIGKQFSTFFAHFEDLYYVAMGAILENMDKYDPTRGAKTTFFLPYIHGAICEYICKNVTFTTKYYMVIEVRVNRWLRSHASYDERVSIQEIVDGVNSDGGDTVPVLGIKRVLEIKKMRAAGNIDIALNWENVFSDSNYCRTPEELVVDMDEKLRLFKALHSNKAKLTPIERDILYSYYGLEGAPVRFKLLAQKYHVTEYFIKKELAVALKKVQKVMGVEVPFKTARA